MKKLILITLIGLTIFSCKKEETTPTATNTGNTNNPADGSVSTATVFSGLLNSVKIISISSTNTIQYNFTNPTAYFSSSPMQYTNPSTGIDVDSVFINANKLQKSTYNYTSSIYTISYPPSNWNVYGKNGIPSFTYTNSDASPDYIGYAQMPDSINKAAAYTFLVSGLSAYSEAQLIVYDGTNTTGHVIVKPITAATTSITILQSELSPLINTSSAIFSVMLRKNNVRYFGGKSFNFLSESQFNKTIKLY